VDAALAKPSKAFIMASLSFLFALTTGVALGLLLLLLLLLKILVSLGLLPLF
jgi:hypothetical protein